MEKTVLHRLPTLQIPMAQLVWNLPFVCCLNKSPSGSLQEWQMHPTFQTPMEKRKVWAIDVSFITHVIMDAGERIPKAVTLSIRAEEQRSTSERKSSRSSGRFQVALQHAIWGNNVNRPGESEKSHSTTSGAMWDGFRIYKLFQSCNTKFSDSQVTDIYNMYTYILLYTYINWRKHCQ